MKTTTLTGTLVALGAPRLHENGDEFDAHGNPPPDRALVHVTAEAIRALVPNLTGREIVIVAKEDWREMQRQIVEAQTTAHIMKAGARLARAEWTGESKRLTVAHAALARVEALRDSYAPGMVADALRRALSGEEGAK